VIGYFGSKVSRWIIRLWYLEVKPVTSNQRLSVHVTVSDYRLPITDHQLIYGTKALALRFRLRTLPLALSCIGMGGFLAATAENLMLSFFLLCCLTTVFLQSFPISPTIMAIREWC